MSQNCLLNFKQLRRCNGTLKWNRSPAPCIRQVSPWSFLRLTTSKCHPLVATDQYRDKIENLNPNIPAGSKFDNEIMAYRGTGGGTLKVLNVAEKNDAAKRISALLSGGNTRLKNGPSVYNKNYQFQYKLWNSNAQMTFTSVSGHLLNYDYAPEYRAWHSVEPQRLFELPLQRICPDQSKDVKTNLEREAGFHSILIIWTDCDREGENIGFEVIDVCKNKNPRLDVYRARFSEMTMAAVTRAIHNLVQPDKRVSDAVDVRMQLDLRIGAAFTRFQTLRLQKRFPGILAGHIISYGSCQFPTLGFVVERYKAIQDFIPEDFWKIEVAHTVDGITVDFNWARVRLFDQLACQTLFEKCEDAPLATVISVKTKPKSKWRPVALDTVEFEKLASKKLGINAKQAMKIAEGLYTKGIISYPRTETNMFPNGLDLRPLVSQHTQDPRWGAFAQRVERDGPRPRNGNKSDQAHPPIHPTKYEHSLPTQNDWKIYELIVRHFLACCSKDALGQETTVEIVIAEEKFIAHGLTVLERNYLEVYPYDKWSDKELPRFTQGQTFIPRRLEMTDGQTSPPNLLTEADLISLMEKHGIGTDATHAEHIETIKNRCYVGLLGNRFVPGQLGMGLVEGYDAMGFHLSKPHLRAGLEVDLKRICEGQKAPDAVLREQVANYRDVFVQAMQQVELYHSDEEGHNSEKQLKVMKLDEAIGKYVDNANAQVPVANLAARRGDTDDDDQ